MKWSYESPKLPRCAEGFLLLPLCADKNNGTGEKEWRWLERARWTQHWCQRAPFELSLRERNGWVPEPDCWIDDDEEWAH